MIREALQYIVGLSASQITTLGNLSYSDKPLTPVKPPATERIEVTTLGGLVDLVNCKFEDFPNNAILHVVSHERVDLVDRIGDMWARRRTFVSAKLQETGGFKFGQFQEHESFTIGLAANFAAGGDRDYLLKIASNLTNEKVVSSDDDGVSQTVGVKASVHLKTTEVIKSRVSLAPFRTFREIDQPVSEFVFRVKQSGDAIPNLALFEADGGKWKIDAMETIGRYLRSTAKDLTVVV